MVATTWALEPEATRRANARLIAAAPAMLEALWRVLRAIEWSETSDRLSESEQAEILRAAIMEATGI